MSLALDAAQTSQLQAKLDAADYGGAETLPARQLPLSATASCPFRCHGITGHGSATRTGPTCSIASDNTIRMGMPQPFYADKIVDLYNEWQHLSQTNYRAAYLETLFE